MRKFEVVQDWAIQYGMKEVKLPQRSTAKAAGYDFFSPVATTIAPGETVKIHTNIKVLMPDNEALILCNRSSYGPKGIVMPNGIGLIDADFYGNKTNDGNMSFVLKNTTQADFEIKVGDKIGQGFFIQYFTVDDDDAHGTRNGGFGSTGE